MTERGNLRAVEVRRGGKPAATLDLYAYLLQGDTRTDVRLETYPGRHELSHEQVRNALEWFGERLAGRKP